ncbi:hypothetical protein BDZ94DRAFT_721035 [Collybia nuda]|uniref:GTP binding protein 2 n=1 Tax=Collybia nuda TaxID=64659 RepID=A0A9P6CJ63_9AGAR|nr:hypothetical protein BDZ94DRAFT_721035 [Collybia nuda]
MFGESESESPRVPSPWDSLISNPPSPSPTARSQATPSPLAAESIPRLVPEADDGNVEYKLQLLSPSPARFARLVTQLKWRLLEGGGQAYYELGVADSGALVGLPRAELEQSLETLEMMAGEIGASVIVVKEIEVPAVMAGLAASQTDLWNGKRNRKRGASSDDGADSSTSVLNSTETETEHSTDFDEEVEDMSATLVLTRPASTYSGETTTASSSSASIFSTDPEPDPADNADAEPDEDPQPSFSIDLEIATVFKPRPMRTRMHSHSHTLMGPAKTKRTKKPKHLPQPIKDDDEPSVQEHRSNRRYARDRKRAEKRKALLAYAAGGNSLDPIPVAETSSYTVPSNPPDAETDALVHGLEALHVPIDDPTHVSTIPTLNVIPDPDKDDGNDDVFASPTTTTSFRTFDSASHLSPSPAISEVETFDQKDSCGQNRLIVEALVVRKMSLDEAFLDFGGFSLI